MPSLHPLLPAQKLVRLDSAPCRLTPPADVMGSPSACDECGKKFKVFGLKKNTAPERPAARPATSQVARDFRRGRRRRPGAAVPVPHRLSGLGARVRRPRVSGRAGRGGRVDAVSDEEDGDSDDDELAMTTLVRQSSIEEEEIQYREMHKIQGAVATWALKEKQARRDLRVSKKESCCPMGPVFQEVCDYETCSAFAVSYAVAATVAVWAAFGLLLVLYLRARSLPAGFSYVL
ncbi:hypothetical protein GN244_ATG12416 [Phytophthora infestans]|uniref:Transmembrane protein n=1 Tax=Phytophthora infestans TaxID=4787 RepID=A0A833T8B5_PHYIN|nr:hypothetical protein GN244_ATG12416 [Phytophthora infestans]